MGRLMSQIPNEDPARLARVQDAKWRTIGVRVVLKMLLLSAGWFIPSRALPRHAGCVHTVQNAYIVKPVTRDARRLIAMPCSGRLGNAR